MAFVPVILVIGVLAFSGHRPGWRSYLGLVTAGLALSTWLYLAE